MEKNDIEQKVNKPAARKLAQKLIKDAKITEAPVSLQKVIEHLQSEFSLDVSRENFSDKVSGLMVNCRSVDKEYTTIVFNENHPWCRRRFTIAHEIGHLLFGHDCRYGENTKEEKEADTFAAELLMPKGLLKKDFLNIKNIPELSKLYRVSQQAMSIKIGDDGLLRI